MVEDHGFKIQIKGSKNIKIDEEGECLIYDLEAKTYNDLVDRNINIPRILVLVDVPETEDAWIEITAAQLVLKRCAYWAQFSGQALTTNKRRKRMV